MAGGGESVTRCVILQPSFIPWRGYFDQVRRADVFLFLDSVQYDKNGWRNRNRIMTSQGANWLTVPVHAKGATQGLPLKDVRIDGSRDWRRKHRLTLEQAYRRAPHFDHAWSVVDQIYGIGTESLADLCAESTILIAAALGFALPRFLRTSEFAATEDRNGRLVSLATQVGATHYLSGPSARSYLDQAQFAAAGIEVEFMEYAYREYPQLRSPFDPQLSILDLLFMTGPEAATFISRPSAPGPAHRG